MARYVDGYVLALPKKKVKAYMALAKKTAALWREHGALQVCEAVGEDLKPAFGVPFSKVMKAKPNETIVFSWAVFKSRAHRDKVNASAMKDPRLADIVNMSNPPSYMKGMVYGGFSIGVDASK